MTRLNNKVLNISLWIAQVVLAAMFLMAGVMKATHPIVELGKSLPWVNDVSIGLVRFLGVSELLGSIGLLLPSILRIKPMLTPLSAMGLFTIMVLAFGFHIMRGEYEASGINTIIGALALFVAWGRYKKSPITVK